MKHTQISKTKFVTSFFDVNMSDFDLYILKIYIFIPLLVLCIPIHGAQLCSVCIKISFFSMEKVSLQSREHFSKLKKFKILKWEV